MEKSAESSIGPDVPIDRISGRTLSDVALWVRRDVTKESAGEIEQSQHTFLQSEAIPRRIGVFTMSLLYPREIRSAAKQAARESNGDQQVGRSQAIETLESIMPPSLREPKTAEVYGLRRFYNKIGIHVGYEEFEEERQALISGMSEILGIDYDWQGITPHVTIARSALDNELSNAEEIEDALPDVIHLTPAQELKD